MKQCWFILFCMFSSMTVENAESVPFATEAIAPLQNGKEWLVTGRLGKQAVVLDSVTGAKRLNIELPGEAGGIAVCGQTAYITIAEPVGHIIKINLTDGRILKSWRAGHFPVGPILSPDSRLLLVANRFENCIRIFDLIEGGERLVPVVHEPVAMAITSDGQRLFVANLLPAITTALDDENPDIAAEVSVINPLRGTLVGNIRLPNGSHSLHGIAVSPDSRYVVVPHIMGNYMPPPLSVDGGMINRNVLSLLDAQTLEWINTAVLDDPERGAANPWAAAFSEDGSSLLITHAGTHELSVINFTALVKRISTRPPASGFFTAQTLRTMEGIRERIPLGINGPRALATAGNTVWIAGFFSDSIAVVNLKDRLGRPRTIALQKPQKHSAARLGEQYFNDAALCRQEWHTCATCHPDGRRDILYWDLMNDGAANFKNTKSLLMSTRTPPAMWRGVRANAAEAIRAGIHHILFTEPKPDQAGAIETYLDCMRPVPGPRLMAEQPEPSKTNKPNCAKCHQPSVPRGSLSASALRGKTLFREKAGCSECHPHPLFTSLKQVDPGLGTGVLYDVPSLIEVWRSAPYLHNGDATTLREAIVDFNSLQKRGKTAKLSNTELDDLIEYLNSL